MLVWKLGFQPLAVEQDFGLCTQVYISIIFYGIF